MRAALAPSHRAAAPSLLVAFVTICQLSKGGTGTGTRGVLSHVHNRVQHTIAVLCASKFHATRPAFLCCHATETLTWSILCCFRWWPCFGFLKIAGTNPVQTTHEPAQLHPCPSCLSIGSVLSLITSHPLCPPVEECLCPRIFIWYTGPLLLSFFILSSSLVVPLSREPTASSVCPHRLLDCS